MKHQTFFKVVLCCSLMAVFSAQVEGQPSQSRSRGLYGDWKVTVDYGRGQFDSILSFSRDAEGNRTAQWISIPEMGEIKAEGKRIGGPLIGDWIIESTFDGRTRKQRLRVNPDMSGLYGSIPIKKVNFEEGRVDFLLVLQFGDQSFEMTFDGKLEDSKLTGEITSSRGSQEVKGTKVVRSFRRRSSQ